ncbi:MAG: DUF507 family protein [Deltaproteobacteria bacterium]|nr:DUF507 family protein [Deltaproteobacteria bacterium]
MRLTEDRISHIALKIHDRLYLDELVDYTDEDEALRVIKKTMADFLAADDQIDDFVREKVRSLKKGVTEGSPEWEVLHKKYYEEELSKRKL